MHAAALSVVYGAQNTSYRIIGATPEYEHGPQPARWPSGDWFTSGDVSAATNVAVLGANVRRTPVPGRRPDRQDDPHQPAGLPRGRRAGAEGRHRLRLSPDDAVYVPITTAQRKLFGGRRPTSPGTASARIYVQVADADQMTDAQDADHRPAAHRHRLTTADNDFSVINQADLLSTLSGVVTIADRSSSAPSPASRCWSAASAS